jgi:hypothetical protein
LQYHNQVGVAAVCRIIACILHNVKLTEVFFDYPPFDYVRHDAWKSEGLRVPPREVVAQGWTKVLRFLRVRCVFARNLKSPRAQLTPCPRPARSSTTA